MVRYFCVDEKFSGLNYMEHCILSIGIIEVIHKDNTYYPDYSRRLYLELKPSGDIDPLSMKIYGSNIDNLTEYGINKENAVREINKYLDLMPNDIAIFISYSGILDKVFLDKLFYDCNQKSPFHHAIIEISSLAIGKLNLEWGFTEIQLLKKIGLQDLNKTNKDGINKVIIHAKEFCSIMNYKA